MGILDRIKDIFAGSKVEMNPDKITSWKALVKAMDSIDEQTGPKLKVAFPIQVMFVAINQKRKNDSAFWRDIPFSGPSPSTIEGAGKYARSAKMSGPMGMFGNVASEYRASEAEGVQRFSQFAIDSLICSVAKCLGKRHLTSEAEAANAAFEAIRYYAKVPVVRYFSMLPAIDDSERRGKLIISEVEICMYRVIESMLLEIYDELGEGEIITDDKVIKKVKRYL